MADLEQWVNLTKDDKWVEDEIKAKERVGHLHVECELKNAKPAAFKVRVYAQSEIKYTKKERSRNDHFKLILGKILATTDKKKTKLEQDIYLPAAGGNKYRVEAKYKDKVVQSSKIVETRRKVFFQEIAMAGISGVPLGPLQAELWSPAKKYFIKLVKKGGAGIIPRLDNIHSNADHTEFQKRVKLAYSLRAYEPHAFALVWVNYLAKPRTIQIIDTVDARVPSKLKFWDRSAHTVTLKLGPGDYLWHALNIDDDAAKKWLVSVACTFTDDAGTSTALTVSRDDVHIADAKRFTHGGHREVRIRLGNQLHLAPVRRLFSAREGKITVSLKLQTVAGWINGFSYSKVNVLVIAEKVWWKQRASAERQGTVNHEVGHTLGMVANGDKKQDLYYNARTPDATASQYEGRNHTGPHCGQGANYVGGNWVGVPKCVMFGESHAQRPTTFCSVCEPAVRKLDLGPGLPAFKSVLGP